MSPPPNGAVRRACKRCGKKFYAGGVWGMARQSTYCSTFCSAGRLDEVDEALERAVLFLLHQRGARGSVAVAEVAAHVGGVSHRRAREAVRRLERAGRVAAVFDGRSQEPDGWVRLASHEPPESSTRPSRDGISRGFRPNPLDEHASG